MGPVSKRDTDNPSVMAADLKAERARLRGEVERLKTELDIAWENCVDLSVMRNVFIKKLAEVSPEAEEAAWREVNERINAMNAKRREKGKAKGEEIVPAPVRVTDDGEAD
jgi:chromosome segregation ATPase